MLDQHRKKLHEQFSPILSTIRKSETPKPEAPTFAITTRSGVSTQDTTFPAPSQSTSANHTEGATKKEGHEDAKPSIIQEPAPRPSIFYQPSKSSNLPFPSRLKKQKKDDEDERILLIFNQIHINLPFLEAMIHMRKGAKRYMTDLFHELIKDSMEVFMEDFSVFDWSLPFEVMCDTSDYAVEAVLGQRIDKHFKPTHYASKTMNQAQENYTTTKKELLAVVFAFDKFRQYLVLVQYHQFDIEIRDKKGAKNLASDHLSRLENPDLGKLTKAKLRDLFLEERLMAISNKNNEPWYVDYDEPFLFKQCAGRIIRRCVARDEAAQILRQCHSGPSRGHHGIATTARKVFESGFYWPHIFCDARKLVQVCDACQRAGNISSRDGSPQKYIQVCEIFDVWGIDFMGPFPSSNKNKYILVAIDYVSKWVEAQDFPTNDARNVVNLLKRLFARFGILKALISDRGTHFCNYQTEKEMKRYGVVHRFSIAYHPHTNGQINELDEMRLDVYESSISYKERTKRWHDKRIKELTNYERGDKVLLFNSCLRLFPEKLKSRWYRPFSVCKDMKNGAIELYDEDGNEVIVIFDEKKLGSS
ncbi:reverse transcriptase domain-containing protein [Tanacetum coccineum]